MPSAVEYGDWLIANKRKRDSDDPKERERYMKMGAAYNAARAAEQKNPTYDPASTGGTLNIGPFDTGIALPKQIDQPLAGLGKSGYDTARTLKQLGTLNSDSTQRSVDAASALDEPLMRTTAGAAGNVAGHILQAVVPGMAISKLATLPAFAAAVPRTSAALARAGSAMYNPATGIDAMAGGAVQGALEPTRTGESRLKNAVVGGAFGGAIPIAASTYQLGKGLLLPIISQTGKENVAARALQRFAKDKNAISDSTQNILVDGSIPKLSEQTGDVGLAQMQRALQNNPEANNVLYDSTVKQQQARLAALKDIAGTDLDREYYEGIRRNMAQELYGRAFQTPPPLTPYLKGQVTILKARPSFQSAWPEAQKLALEDGLKLDPSNVVQVMHYTKMALDDQISEATRAGKDALASKIGGTRDQLLSVIEHPDFAPAYRDARQGYAAMSRPLNQMAIGERFYNDLVPALTDLGAERYTPNKFAESWRRGDDTAAKATGFSGARIDQMMEPEQYASLHAVGEDVGRTVGAQERGRAPGSPTAQNTVMQDVLRSTLGPMGIPGGIGDMSIAHMMMKIPSFFYSIPEAGVMGILGRAHADPTYAKDIVDYMQRRSPFFQKLDELLPYASPYSAGVGEYKSQPDY